MGIRKNSFTKAVLFFFMPFISFIYSLFDIRSRSSAFVFISFVALFGYAFAFAGDGADSYRYAVGFHFSDYNSIDDVIALYRNGELRDFYRSLLFVVLSQFTKNPKVLFGVAGAVYGAIMYLSLISLKDQMGSFKDKTTLVLFYIFISLIPITGLNGFRFWTGAWFLYYSSIKFLLYNKNRWALGVLITPLFHYSFMITLPIVFLYKIIGKYFYSSRGVDKILLAVFTIAFLATWVLDVNTINVGFIQKYIPLEAVNSRIDYINDSEGAQEMHNARVSGSFFLTVRTYFDYGIRIYMFILILYINKIVSKLRSRGYNILQLNKMIAFVLFFVSVGYLAKNISVGGRYLTTFYLFAVFLAAKLYTITRDKGLKKLIWISIPVFSFEFLFFNIYLPIGLVTPLLWWAGLPVIILDGLNFIFKLIN